jgi:hypothetical protein
MEDRKACMAFELEALVGHLYIAGKRAINTTPPGALVEVAPIKAARGRETDTFFVLVLPSGNVAPTSFYEQMAKMSTERYFATGGSVTSALREVFNSLNYNLFEHNRSGRRHYETNLICAVLRDEELYIGRVGAGAAVLRHSGITATYPENLTDDDALYQPPLGVQPMPNIELKRYNVGVGSRLILTDANIAEIRLEKITQALVAQKLEETLTDFKLMVTLQIQMMVIEFVPVNQTPSDQAITGESSEAINKQIALTRQAEKEAAQAEEDGEAQPEADDVGFVKRLLGKTARTMGQFLTGLGEILDSLVGAPTVDETTGEKRSRLPSIWVTLLIIALPMIVVLLVVVSWAGGVGETAFEACVGRAEEAADVARALDSSNPAGVLAAWQGTLTIVDQCEEQRAGDATLEQLRTEGRRVIDGVNNIQRRNTSTIAAFPSATISNIVQQGLDIYALDDANDLVYRVQLNTDGMSAISVPQPIANMRRGATVDGLQVGNIFAVGFDDQLNTIVAIDDSGVLVRCPPRFVMECDAQRVPGSENWVNPVTVTLWRGALYVLDTGANQLWRYTPTGGNYASQPTEYFTGAARPNLATAVDFDITRTGTGIVYVLFAEGNMVAYLGGEPQPFGFVGFPLGQELENTTLQGMYMNDSPVLPAFYIISQPLRTIYQTTLAGTYQNSYRVFDEDLLELLADIVVEPAQQLVYLASGNSIVAFRMDDPSQ